MCSSACVRLSSLQLPMSLTSRKASQGWMLIPGATRKLPFAEVMYSTFVGVWYIMPCSCVTRTVTTDIITSDFLAKTCSAMGPVSVDFGSDQFLGY